MKRALYISNILAHIHSFHLPYIKMLKNEGYTVDVIANSCGLHPLEEYDNFYDVSISRSPYSLKNLLLYREIKRIIEENDYDLIHVHTPMGGVLGRLSANRVRKAGTKVFYTSHGFHFYKGAPLINWLLYYPVEVYLAKMTDCIITINQEDYRLAKQFAPSGCDVEYLDGVGVDLSKFIPRSVEQKEYLKTNYSLKGKIVLLYAAEFISRKNHSFLIEAFSKIHAHYPNTVLLLAGQGPKMEKMMNLVSRLDLNESVQFLGYRRDVPQLLEIADLVISSSRQEGFPINIAEAVASGVPSVVSDIRGNIDIIENEYNGFTYDRNNIDDLCEKAERLISDRSLWDYMSTNCQSVSQRIDITELVDNMMRLYNRYL